MIGIQAYRTMIVLGIPEGWSVRYVDECPVHGFVLFDELDRAMKLAQTPFELLFPEPGNLRYFQRAAYTKFLDSAKQEDGPNFFIYENAKLG